MDSTLFHWAECTKFFFTSISMFSLLKLYNKFSYLVILVSSFTIYFQNALGCPCICELQNHFAKFSNILLDFNWYFIKFTNLGKMGTFILLNLSTQEYDMSKTITLHSSRGLHYIRVMKCSACVAIDKGWRYIFSFIQFVFISLSKALHLLLYISCTFLVIIISGSFIFLLLLWMGSFYPLDFLPCLLLVYWEWLFFFFCGG